MNRDGESGTDGKGVLMRLRRFWPARQGAMAVEFAIVGPIFLIMLISVIEFGRYYMLSSSLQYAVEEAGRFAMTKYTRDFWADESETEVNLVDAVKDDAEANTQTRAIDWINYDFNITGTPKTGTTPSTLLITGTATFDFLIPFVPHLTISIQRQTEVPMIKFDT